MALTDDQKKWADSHVGVETTLSGAVASWKENEDGTVTFTVTFEATPPPSPDQIAAQEAAAEAEREAADKAAQEAAVAQASANEEVRKQAEAADRERIKAIVTEVLAEQ